MLLLITEYSTIPKEFYITGPWVYITAVMILQIVQYPFCKSPLELVVVVSICILYLYFVFCGPLLWALHCVIIHRDQVDILWQAMSGPI